MMKCKIVLNSGLLFILLHIIKIECSHFTGGSYTIQELCLSNRHIYSVGPGETQQLKLSSNTSSGDINKWHQKSKRKCRKEYKTNNAASHFVLTLSNMTIPSCSEKCHCNYLEISEPGNTERYCGKHEAEVYFESRGDYLAIDIHHGLSLLFEITLTFKVERNTYILEDSSKKGLVHSLETPYFPNTYQSDYIADYIIRSNAHNGRVMLLFLDFLIPSESYIEVVGHNGSHPVRVNGTVFRPPVFVSQSNELNLRFEANNQPGRSGFKAICYYIKDDDVPSSVPDTNCGGKMSGYGGSLHIKTTVEKGYYDCLWHLSPSFFPNSKTNFLSVSIESLQNIGSKAILEFREGLTSKSKLVKSIFCNESDCSKSLTEITVPAESGLYVRFNGYLNSTSVVKMVYSTYYSGNCSDKELACHDRCLMPSLYCDGIPHCPDGEDEMNCLTTTLVQLIEVNTSNVTIKGVLGSNFWNASLLILVVGIFGLILSISVFIIAFCCYKKTIQLSEMESVQSHNSEESSGHSPIFPSQRPHHENLPTYEDFIRCSDRYPPLLYTRMAKRYSEPYRFGCNILHTTSFCGQDESIHNSSESKSLDSACSERTDSIRAEEPSCSYEQSSLRESMKSSLLREKSCGLRRTRSHESKLNQVLDSCHLHLSITHSFVRRPESSKYYSLPPNLKIMDVKSNDNVELILQANIPKVEWGRRKISSSVTCRDTVSISSEIMAAMKSRCHSDPCTRVSVHYSLYH